MSILSKFSHRRSVRIKAALAALFLASWIAVPLWGQDKPDKVDDFVNEVDQSANPPDLDQIKSAHLSDLTHWRGVQPINPRPDSVSGPTGWRVVDADAIASVSQEPATTLLGVPEAGEYRIWLRYLARPDAPQPMTLTISAPGAAGAVVATHEFGSRELSHQEAKLQERNLPIHFETEDQRMGIPTQPTWIWEYCDVTLKPGPTLFSLGTMVKDVHVGRLFISRSKSFRPSLINDPPSATLNRTYYRFRVVEKSDAAYNLTGSLTYHWGRTPPKGGTEPIWYYPFFSSADVAAAGNCGPIKAGEWTGFIDVTNGISASGPWATASIGLPGIKHGTLEVQLAWSKSPAAVVKTIRTRIESGSAMILIPIDPRGYSCAVSPPGDTTGAWGMRPPEYLKLLETPEDVNERHMSYARAALAALPRQGNPAPKLIRLSTGNGSASSVRDASSQMLATLGINTIDGASPATRKRLGLRDELTLYENDALYYCETNDPTDPLIDSTLARHFEGIARSLETQEAGSSSAAAAESVRDRVTILKMGDEIGAIVGPSSINGFPDARALFHDYLREQLRIMGRGPEFFGVRNVDELDFMPDLPPNAGRFERRLYYESARFNFVFTARFYERFTGAAKKVFPNVRTYCNFSPHPPMFGQNMNSSDWFSLTRNGGATMAWAEDWAGLGGSWNFAGIQTVSYYAALVECAARKNQLPAGFYVVTSMSGADRKTFSLIAHGIMNIDLYSFGPRYIGAEFSNFWDEQPGAYREIANATYALGPADTIIAKGHRETRRIGLLYNRSHEIWNAGYGGFQSDRLLTFLALQQAHLPVDILLEEDLTSELLKQYQVLYVQGFNLADRHVEALHQWVQDGGTLVGFAGTAMRDEYNDSSDAGAKLFGATQRLAGVSAGDFHPQSIPGHNPIDHITVTASSLTPAFEADVVGVKVILLPTSAKTVATYKDGSAAGVMQDVGKGRTLLWGVMPGLLYKGDAKGGNHYRHDRLPLVAMPATAALGPQRVEVSDPMVETCLFEHESGIAVTLNEVAVNRPGATTEPSDSTQPATPKITVSILTDRPIKEVLTSYAGPLPWTKVDGRIVVEVPLPKPVDVLILR